MESNLGQNNSVILKNFRKLCKGYVEQFKASKNDVFHLLGKKQAYSSGIFRESLLKEFLKKILPKVVSVDSGFIYGFDEIENSGQIDILIWDSSNFGAIFKSDEFVILPPEAVLIIITVKSNMNKNDIIDGLKNLSSVIKIDLNYRVNRVDNSQQPLFRPIKKFFISYKSSSPKQRTLDIVKTFYDNLFKENNDYEKLLLEKLKVVDPYKPSIEIDNIVKTFFPVMITSLESKEKCFLLGWGPPNDLLGTGIYKEGMKRIPFLYQTSNEITSQFEKLIYHILSIVYTNFETKAFSTLAAWSDLNPISGCRVGDSSEIIESCGKELINYK